MHRIFIARGTTPLLAAAGCLAGALLIGPIHAEEGMWLPEQLPELADELEAMGLELQPGFLADLEQGPAAAVIQMMGGTASFVSASGLILTNHHVAFEAIQERSNAENDYIVNGFLADSQEEELVVPSYRANRVMSMISVTDDILGAIPEGADGKARYDAIEKRTKELVAGCEEDSEYRCSVRPMSGGLMFFLVENLEFKDIRIVYAPPEGVGNYGGDIDNFMWPRHTGDFSFMRVYVGPDGKPAEYSEDNVPYHPPVYLKQASEPLEAGDMTLTIGFPGRTSRYRTSLQVAYAQEEYYPKLIEYVSDWLGVLEEAARTDRERAIRLASMREGLANALKNFEGKLVGLETIDLVSVRKREEEALMAWVQEDPARKSAYGDVISEIEELTEARWATAERDLALRRLQRSSQLFFTASTFVRMAEELPKPDMERDPGFMARTLPRLRKHMELMQQDLDPEVDRILLEKGILVALDLPEGQRLDALDSMFKGSSREATEKHVAKTLDKWYRKTRLTDTDYRLSLMDGGAEAIEASSDPLIELARTLRPSIEARDDAAEAYAGAMSRLTPRLMEAIMAFNPGPEYPDANSSLRISYGSVKGYSPGDAVTLAPFTTLQGLVEKEKGERPFDSPEALLDALKGHEGLPINFVSTNDTTGGNSGSPVLNARGEIVGLLFDGNYEGTCDDFVFWEERGRSISVDLRYVIWYLEQVDNATKLLQELQWASSQFHRETEAPDMTHEASEM